VEVIKRRIIKHRNRRLYDALRGRAITLLELSDLVASGENVAVELSGTGEDITAVTLLASFAERIRRRPSERLGGEVTSLLSHALRRAAVTEPGSLDDDGSASARREAVGHDEREH
jgi:polyhydroxyalkanoate synthesis regulator protein